MAVLQHSVPVVGYFDAEILPVQAVPFRRQVLNCEFVMHYALFELVANHDVQRVCQFISFSPYKRRLRLVHCAVEFLRVVSLHLFREEAHEFREYKAAERSAPADDVFIKPALALVYAHRHSAVEHRVGELAGRTCIIKRMPAFVDHAVHGKCEIILVIMRGDALIMMRTEARCKWMLCC